MIMFDGVVGLALIAVWIFCFIDVITTPEGQCRNLPKLAWVFIVLLFMAAGSLAWLVCGRPWAANAAARTGASGVGVRAPSGRSAPMSPDDDEEFLASLRARAEEQRRRAREAERGDDKA